MIRATFAIFPLLLLRRVHFKFGVKFKAHTKKIFKLHHHQKHQPNESGVELIFNMHV